MTGQHTGVKMPGALQTVLLETDHETLVVDYMALRDVTNKIVALAVAGDTELCAKIVEWAHDDTSTSLDPPSAIAPASPDTWLVITAVIVVALLGFFGILNTSIKNASSYSSAIIVTGVFVIELAILACFAWKGAK